MTTWFALFRGINVGGHNKLPMKDLTAIFEEAGCADVRTYIQSGNVVFRNERLPDENFAVEIGERVTAKFGFEPRILLLDRSALDGAVAGNPFDTSIGKALHFCFLETIPDEPDLATLETLKIDSEEFLLKDMVFYLFTPEGIGRSKMAARVEKCLGVPVTARNWNTVGKLLEMASS